MLKTIRNLMLMMLCFVTFLCSFQEEDEKCFVQAFQNERVSQVILGGNTIGIEYTPSGVLVLSVNENINNELKVGDIIKTINEKEICSSNQITEILNKDKTGHEFKVTYYRNNKERIAYITPSFDLISKKYMLGVWVKDEVSGVGTLTYINPNTGYFGSLGHPITVGGQTKNLSVKTGRVYSCDVVGIVKGAKGVPGELRGVISKSKELGKVTKNSECGVFGTIEDKSMLKNSGRLVDIGGKKTIKPGKAEIFCSLNSGEIRAYDIQIIKTSYQNVSSNKSLVFKVVDKELIAKTGGIVQGMSGSPIVQNGKLVGAVTHVFTNDPTKGFGIYIDWMMW